MDENDLRISNIVMLLGIQQCTRALCDIGNRISTDVHLSFARSILLYLQEIEKLGVSHDAMGDMRDILETMIEEQHRKHIGDA